MQLTKSLTVLAGAAMVALTLAVPVADGPVDAVAAARETPQAMVKSPTKHTTKASNAHTTKPVKPHTTTKAAKSPATKPTKLQTTKPAQVKTTKTAKPPITTPKLHPTTPVKPPATNSKIKQTKTSAKPAKPPVIKPAKTSTVKPVKASTAKSVKATTTKPVKATATKSVKASTAKTRKPAVPKSVKSHTTKSSKTPVTKPSKQPASKSAQAHITKSTKRPVPTKLPSNSTSTAPSTPSSPASCPLPPKADKKPSVLRRLYDKVMRLYERVPGQDVEEFVGWHGTNDKTVAFWESQGNTPLKPPSSAPGTSGADAEFGYGLYVTDDVFKSHGFANGNSAKNNNEADRAGLPKDFRPKVCAIFAKSKNDWRSANSQKLVMPVIVKGNSASLESRRIRYIGLWTHPGSDVAKVQRFAPLTLPSEDHDITGAVPVLGVEGQFVLVQNEKFTARCFDPTSDGTTPPGAENTRTYPELSYFSTQLQQEWLITPEHLVPDENCSIAK